MSDQRPITDANDPAGMPADAPSAGGAQAEGAPVGTAALASAGSRPASPDPRPAAGEPGDGADQGGAREALFPADRANDFRSRWETVQGGFVDEPRKAVEDADALVAEVMKQLATTFADERADLEGRWSKGSDVSTEDLRQALRRYRSFFDRLLSL